MGTGTGTWWLAEVAGAGRAKAPLSCDAPARRRCRQALAWPGWRLLRDTAATLTGTAGAGFGALAMVQGCLCAGQPGHCLLSPRVPRAQDPRTRGRSSRGVPAGRPCGFN